MVTIAVAVVLISLAVPGFRDLIEKSRLRGATDDLVNLLNASRASAVKLGLDVNASVMISGNNWCAGSISATDPLSSSGTVGQAANSAAACDCTSNTVTCKVSGLGKQAGQTLIVSSGSYSGITLSSDSANVLLNTNDGLIFNSKMGTLDFSVLATVKPLILTSNSGKYKTQITVSPLGQTNVCTPSGGGFVSGYASC